MTEFPRGRFCWHEMLTTNTENAKSFYTKVIGWGTMGWERDQAYTMWTAGETPVGGLMNLPDEVLAMGVPPNWLTYIAVADAGATCMRATTLGGDIVREPEAVPDVGSFAMIRDPQGAVFAVLQPSGEAPGHDGAPKVGEFSWHELVTTDWSGAWSFYQALFGWEHRSSFDMGAMGTYFIYGRSGRDLGGIYNKPAEMPAPPHWLPYVRVPSLDRAVASVKQAGGTVINGPMDVPGGDRVAQILDPLGAAFALHETASRAAAVPEPAPAKEPRKSPTARKRPASEKPAKKKAAKKKPMKKKPVKKAAKRARRTKKR